MCRIFLFACRDMSMDELVMDRKVEDEADCHYLHNGG